jgi:predicted GNAT family acetyltransferase
MEREISAVAQAPETAQRTAKPRAHVQPAPAAPSDVALAVQRGVGNAALARRLMRAAAPKQTTLQDYGFTGKSTSKSVAVVIKGSNGEYEAHDAGSGVKVGELTLHEDDKGKQWIAGVEVAAKLQRQGIGKKLVAFAIEDIGATLYASNKPKSDDDPNDTRHLSTEGAKLVNSCIRDGLKIEYADPKA